MRDICYSILSLYKRKKPHPERIEDKINELKQAIAEKKLAAKGLSGVSANATPNSTSRAGTPSKVSPSPHPSVHRIKDEEAHSDGSL